MESFLYPVITFVWSVDSVWIQHQGQFIFAFEINNIIHVVSAVQLYKETVLPSNERPCKPPPPPVCAYLGIYDKMLGISISMANDACHSYIQEYIVCPTHLLQNAFTSSDKYNIDHFTSSVPSKDSFHTFHSTSIFVFQNISQDVQVVLKTID